MIYFSTCLWWCCCFSWYNGFRCKSWKIWKKGETKSLVPFAASSIPLVTLGLFYYGLVGLALTALVN